MAVWGTSHNQQITGVGPILGFNTSGAECDWRPNLLKTGRRPPGLALKVAFVTTVTAPEPHTDLFSLKACFEVMGNILPIRAHTRELCPNDKTLPILSAPFACEGICRKRRRLLFFKSDSKCDFSKATFGKIRQKAVELTFFVLFFFFAR